MTMLPDLKQHNRSRNLFSVDNARMMSLAETVGTFVPTAEFWKLLTPANQIILGARGSGKTALVKMLSHPYLRRLPGAEGVIGGAELVGIYVPMSTTWASSMKNKPWRNDTERDVYFNWRLNMAACNAALDTLASCVECYVEEPQQAIAERKLMQRLSKIWSPECDPPCTSIEQMREYLQDLEMLRQMQLAETQTTGRIPPPSEVRGARV